MVDSLTLSFSPLNSINFETIASLSLLIQMAADRVLGDVANFAACIIYTCYIHIHRYRFFTFLPQESCFEYVLFRRICSTNHSKVNNSMVEWLSFSHFPDLCLYGSCQILQHLVLNSSSPEASVHHLYKLLLSILLHHSISLQWQKCSMREHNFLH